MLTIARYLPPLLLIVCLAGCSTDDGTSDTTDASDSDTVSDAERDTAPEDTREELYCNAERVCCDDSGSYVTSIIVCDSSDRCPDGTKSYTCSEEARCFDAPNPKPDCVNDDGESVEPTCFEFETISRWECPGGTADAGGDAGRDGGL